MADLSVLKNIALNGTPAEKRELFSFSLEESDERILLKYKLFARSCYHQYFTHKAPKHHDTRIKNYLQSYRGLQNGIEIAYRGDAKTSHAKLFITFVILNDKNAFRRYMKVLSRDLKNAAQLVTDVYNNIVSVAYIYGDIFEKEGDIKREERMGSFTTKRQQKLIAGTVGQTQRGHLQDAFRPDWVLFEDVEDRESVSSIAITEGVIQRCDEAIQGLAFNGSYHVNANYISDAGTIQWFLNKSKILKHIVPIIDGAERPAWDRYTPEILEKLKADSEDWAGEYLCDPTRSGSKFFDVTLVRAMLEEATPPIKHIGLTRRWADYNPSHRYGMGLDLSDGVGGDSCALVLFDFTNGTIVATADSNEIAPDIFTYEAIKLGEEFGNCIIAPEINNTCGGIAISALKDRNYPNIYQKEITDNVANVLTKRLGWHTSGKSKTDMLYEFKRDFNDGHITISDERILKEMLSYTMSDLGETQKSAITRHFDLLMSTAIAYQMDKFAGNNSKVADFYANLRGTKKFARS